MTAACKGLDWNKIQLIVSFLDLIISINQLFYQGLVIVHLNDSIGYVLPLALSKIFHDLGSI
jgi:hypothetical protein